MKKISFGIFYFLVILMSFSCSNELVLNEKPKEIPVVYGFLSRSDTAQYIRVERAFLSADKSALELAKDPNEVYYNNITVEILDIEKNKTYPLTRVDGNKEGYKRTTGNFVDAPNYIYKIKTKNIDLRGGKSYKLVVKKNDGAVLTEATAVVLPDMTYEIPDPYELSLATFTTFRWSQYDYRLAKVYDVIMHIKVDERNPLENTWVPVKGLDWTLSKNFTPGSAETVPNINVIYFPYKDANSFYRFLSEKLDKDKKVVRRFRGIDLEVVSGGNDLFQYQSINNVNSGITGTEVLPNYTNTTNGGYGILSSRNQFIAKGLGLNQRATDSLFRGRYTKPLNFQ